MLVEPMKWVFYVLISMMPYVEWVGLENTSNIAVSTKLARIS